MSESESVTKKNGTIPALQLSFHQMNLPKVPNLEKFFFPGYSEKEKSQKAFSYLECAQRKGHKIRLQDV